MLSDAPAKRSGARGTAETQGPKIIDGPASNALLFAASAAHHPAFTMRPAGATLVHMKITAGTIVRIDYEIRVKGGDVIESSAKSGPVQYVHGEGKLLPALERRLEGLSAGQTLEGEIPAAEVIPPEDTLPKRVIPRAEFPGADKLEVGALFEAQTAGGGKIDLRVIAIDDKNVTARLLPPLVGKDLAFKVKVMRIEDPVSHLVSVVRKPPPPVVKTVELDVEPEED